jgi:hypothetical protein
MTEPKKSAGDQEFLTELATLSQRLSALSRLSIRQFLGNRSPEDPRFQYLASLEATTNLANVQLEVVLELLSQLFPKEKFREAQVRRLAAKVTEMEEDFCVTSWDDNGSPIFDLTKFTERTKSWPQ